MPRVKILLYTHGFAPVIGGVETHVALLAEGLIHHSPSSNGRAFEITVVTPTPAGDFNDSNLPFRVVRRPGFWKLIRLAREADVVHLAGPCLVPLALAWLMRKPVVVVHHGYQAIRNTSATKRAMGLKG